MRLFLVPKHAETVEELDRWHIEQSNSGLTQEVIDKMRADFTAFQKANDQLYLENANGIERAREIVDKFYSDYEKKRKACEPETITISFEEYKNLKEIKKKYELAKEMFK